MTTDRAVAPLKETQVGEPSNMQARILRAATEQFYLRGYHATTMRELATAVGMTPGSLYNHFNSKQDVLLAIAGGSMSALLEGGRKALAETQSNSDGLKALVSWHVRFHAERRLEAIVQDTQLNALEPENRARVVAVRDDYESLFRELLLRGNAEGEWQVRDVLLLARAIPAMCTGVGVWYREGGRLTPQQIADEYVEFVLAGCKGAGNA